MSAPRRSRWLAKKRVVHREGSAQLPIKAPAVRARCERTAVKRCRASFAGPADFGSVMPILSVGVRWGRAIGWVCKPEVTGSIPVRSMETACKSNLSGDRASAEVE
jgi:hypothetical protein